MAYVSTLALQSKQDRALTLGLAAADLLVRGGERVGAPGLTRPIAARNIVDRLAESLIEEAGRRDHVPAELPPPDPLAPRTQIVILSDMLNAPDDIRATIHSIASRGAIGHVVMISDPIEDTFPFTGHTEFLDVDSDARLRLGEAQSFKTDYIRRLAAHRDAVREACASRGWSFTLHRTDRPASEALLALRVRLEGPQGGTT
jgi:uncharacterized protein (DUF58 family)